MKGKAIIFKHRWPMQENYHVEMLRNPMNNKALPSRGTTLCVKAYGDGDGIQSVLFIEISASISKERELKGEKEKKRRNIFLSVFPLLTCIRKKRIYFHKTNLGSIPTFF